MSLHNNIRLKTLLRGAMGMLSVLLLLPGGAGLHVSPRPAAVAAGSNDDWNAF